MTVSLVGQKDEEGDEQYYTCIWIPSFGEKSRYEDFKEEVLKHCEERNLETPMVEG